MNDLFSVIHDAAQTIASPNWADKVAAIASVIAVIVSAIAIIVAGIVAYGQKKISDTQVEISRQQNRIALFEKRYEIYELIQTYNHFIWLIHATANKNEDLCRLYVMSKSTLGIEDDLEFFDNTEVVASCIMNSAQKLCQAEFLFPQDIADYAKCLERELKLIAILCLYPKHENIKNSKESLKELLDRYDSEKLNEKIIEELRTTISKK